MKKMKYLYVILFSALFVVGVSTVKAEEYVDLSKVVEKFNAFDVKVDYEPCTSQDGKVTAKYNSDTASKGITFTCKSEGEALITLKEDDNHTLSFTETEYTDEKLEKAIFGDEGDEETDPEYVLKHNAYTVAKYDIMGNFFEAFLNESGYSDMALPYTFEEEGYLLDASVIYSVGIPERMDVRTGKVFFEPINVKDLKLSLDKEKIKTFVEKVGDKYIRKLMDITPSLTLNNVTANSAKLNVKIDLEVDEGYQASCLLFRSDTPDFDIDFSYIYGHLVQTVDNCLGDVVITDNDLTPNTTYYYKILLEGSTKISDPIAVTTASAEPVTPTPEKPNPNTGAFVPGALLGLLAIGGIGTLVYTNRKNKFKNY